MLTNHVPFDATQKLVFGKFAGKKLTECPPGYLYWLIHIAKKIGPELRRSAAAALVFQSQAKLRETFGPMESRYAFPDPPYAEPAYDAHIQAQHMDGHTLSQHMDERGGGV